MQYRCKPKFSYRFGMCTNLSLFVSWGICHHKLLFLICCCFFFMCFFFVPILQLYNAWLQFPLSYVDLSIRIFATVAAVQCTAPISIFLILSKFYISLSDVHDLSSSVATSFLHLTVCKYYKTFLTLHV